MVQVGTRAATLWANMSDVRLCNVRRRRRPKASGQNKTEDGGALSLCRSSACETGPVGAEVGKPGPTRGREEPSLE
eukprot:9849193-Alexandrium_andersonii.AAC.1